jgi:zinc protease
MSKKWIVLLALGALATTGAWAAEEQPLPKELPPFAPDKPLPVPPIAQSKTAEGLTVWVVKRTGFPKLTAVLAVRGGRAADPANLPGLSELLAATVTDGTPTRSSQQIASELQAVGGEISARSTKDALYVTVDGLASGAGPLLAMLADVARNASFPAGEVALAKSNALQNLQARASQPEFPGNKAFSRALFGEHPYHVIAPTPESIAATTPETLKAEFLRRFRPERSLLVVVGDVEAAATARQVAKSFGGWKTASAELPETPPAPTPTGRAIYFVDRPGSIQSLLLVGSSAPSERDPDYYPVVVANTIFGGAFGSRLTRNIREDKGYTYSPGSGLAPYQAGGQLQVNASVRTEVTSPTLKEIFFELDRMGTSRPTDEELSTAKRWQTGLYLLRNQIQGGLAALLADYWVNGLPPGELGEFVPKVNAVTAADVERVGKEVFASGRQLVVVVGDSSKAKADLAQFGPVEDVKP